MGMETLDFYSSLIPRFLLATTISLDAALIKVSVDTVELGLKVQASAETLGLHISHTANESQHLEPSAKVSMLLIQNFQNMHMLFSVTENGYHPYLYNCSVFTPGHVYLSS